MEDVRRTREGEEGKDEAEKEKSKIGLCARKCG
jgi:hypothetical protein